MKKLCVFGLVVLMAGMLAGSALADSQVDVGANAGVNYHPTSISNEPRQHLAPGMMPYLPYFLQPVNGGVWIQWGPGVRIPKKIVDEEGNVKYQMVNPFPEAEAYKEVTIDDFALAGAGKLRLNQFKGGTVSRCANNSLPISIKTVMPETKPIGTYKFKGYADRPVLCSVMRALKKTKAKTMTDTAMVWVFIRTDTVGMGGAVGGSVDGAEVVGPSKAPDKSAIAGLLGLALGMNRSFFEHTPLVWVTAY